MSVKPSKSARAEPIIIYLDSQDFSRLAEPPPSKREFYENLDSELSRFVACEEIEVRYSAVHVSEISHTSDAAMKHSAARAQILKRLCAGKCMSFWTDILDDEIRRNIDPAHVVVSKQDGDQWFDFQFNDLGGFLTELKNSLHDSLKEKGVNRKKRRAAGKIDLGHLITQTSKGQALLDRIVSELNDRYPVERELDRKTLADYICGRIDDHKFERYVRGLMVDPVNLIERLAPKFDKPLKLPSIVRDQGRTLIDGMNPSLEKVAKLLAKLPGDAIFDSIRRDAAATPGRSAIKIRRNTVRRHLGDLANKLPGPISEIQDDVIDGMLLPSIDVLVDTFRHYLDEVVSASKAGKAFRRFEQSDGADLIHAAYIPYVDVFRCDTAWADRLKAQGAKFNTAVVGRIEDLVPTIRRRLASAG